MLPDNTRLIDQNRIDSTLKVVASTNTKDAAEANTWLLLQAHDLERKLELTLRRD
jgi:hypothetical protein